ncbi:hypothetical protein Ciccas_010933 [Cichlidogyrus casuarinus]|uniref:Apple domain-containing protein n=1 Tax=Cichlidogyrus casuarinus TaxID=1844966 RepID=A0ABD2PTV7_9PLAT
MGFLTYKLWFYPEPHEKMFLWLVLVIESLGFCSGNCPAPFVLEQGLCYKFNTNNVPNRLSTSYQACCSDGVKARPPYVREVPLLLSAASFVNAGHKTKRFYLATHLYFTRQVDSTTTYYHPGNDSLVTAPIPTSRITYLPCLEVKNGTITKRYCDFIQPDVLVCVKDDYFLPQRGQFNKFIKDQRPINFTDLSTPNLPYRKDPTLCYFVGKTPSRSVCMALCAQDLTCKTLFYSDASKWCFLNFWLDSPMIVNSENFTEFSTWNSASDWQRWVITN